MAALDTPPAPPASAPETPPAPPAQRNVLPEGVKVDNRHDAGEYYSKFDQERKAVAAAKAPAPTAPAAPTPPAAEPAPAAPTIADKLKAKLTPVPAAPEPKPAPAPETLPEDKLQFESRDSAKSAQWKELHGITKGLRDQLIKASERESALRTEVENVKKGAHLPDPAEIEKLRKENEALSKRLLVVDLQEHPQFQAEFVAPREQALTQAQELLDANQVKDVRVAALLELPRADFGKAVSEAAKSLPAFDQTDFAENMRRAYGLRQQAGQALAKSREIYQGLRNNQLDTQKKAFEEVAGAAMGTIGEHAVELEVTDPTNEKAVQAAERYNSGFRGIRADAEKIALAATTPKDIASAAFQAAAYRFHIQHVQPALLADFAQLRSINAGLLKEIEALRGTNPKRQIRGSTSAAGEPVDPGKMDHHEAADYWMNKRD